MARAFTSKGARRQAQSGCSQILPPAGVAHSFPDTRLVRLCPAGPALWRCRTWLKLAEVSGSCVPARVLGTRQDRETLAKPRLGLNSPVCQAESGHCVRTGDVRHRRGPNSPPSIPPEKKQVTEEEEADARFMAGRHEADPVLTLTCPPLFCMASAYRSSFVSSYTEYGAPEDGELKTQQPFLLRNQLLSKTSRCSDS